MDPLVEEVELIQENSHYAYVLDQNGENATVSTTNLAPVVTPINEEPIEIHVDEVGETKHMTVDSIGDYPALPEKSIKGTPIKPDNTPRSMSNPTDAAEEAVHPRRSGGIRHPRTHLDL